MKENKIIRTLSVLIFMIFLLFSYQLTATILYDFETSVNGWVKAEWGFTDNPVWDSSRSYRGHGSCMYTNTMIHNWNGAGKRYHGDPGLDLRGYTNLTMWIRTPDNVEDGVTYVVLQLFTRSGGSDHGWVTDWGPELQGFLTHGTWYQVSMKVSDITHASNVNDLAFQIKYFNTTNFCEVNLDFLEAWGTNSYPKPVRFLQAVSSGTTNFISWTNSYNSDLMAAMIRYKTNGYPESPADGELLCIKTGLPGQGYTTNHSGLHNGRVYYYSAFAINSASNYSALNDKSKVQILCITDTNLPYKVSRFSAARQEIIRYGKKNTVAYNAMHLSWIPPVADNLYVDYILCRAEEPLNLRNVRNRSAENLKQFNIDDGFQASYVDTSITSFEKKYYYALLTIYGLTLTNLSQDIVTLTYDPDDEDGWIYRSTKPNYIWQEAEKYTSKTGASDKTYNTGSGGVLVENFYDESAGAHLTYSINIKEDMSKARIFLRKAAVGTTPKINVYIDGIKKVDGWAIETKGSDWYAFDFTDTMIGDGSLSRGTHTVKITRSDFWINLDGFFIYDTVYGDFTPDNTLVGSDIALPPSITINMRKINIDYDVKNKIDQDPYYSAAKNNPLIIEPQAVTAYELSLDGKKGILFDKAIDLSLDFLESDIPVQCREKDLKVFYWDGADWHKIGGEIKTAENLIDFKVNHLGLFAVFAAKDQVYDCQWSYNPFAPNGQGDYQKTTMSFTVLEDSVIRVKIINLNGKLIRTVMEEKVSPGTVNVEWDGKDQEGRDIPLGVYIYQVEGLGDIINGTITILK